tara:strand:+ start:940 stop:2787 length:1848 start_codon:yes stop_codon:yes gene_type:complete
MNFADYGSDDDYTPSGTVKAKKRKQQRCRKCGQIRKGHKCTAGTAADQKDDDDDNKKKRVNIIPSYSPTHGSPVVSRAPSPTPAAASTASAVANAAANTIAMANKVVAKAAVTTTPAANTGYTIRVGDFVAPRKDIKAKDFMYGLGIDISSVGKVVAVNVDTSIKVDFPERKDWKGLEKEVLITSVLPQKTLRWLDMYKTDPSQRIPGNYTPMNGFEIRSCLIYLDNINFVAGTHKAYLHWEFEDGMTYDSPPLYNKTNSWVACDDATSNKLSDCLKDMAFTSSIDISIRSADYKIDLMQMIQVRQSYSNRSAVNYGYTRRLRVNGYELDLAKTSLHQPAGSTSGAGTSSAAAPPPPPSPSPTPKFPLPLFIDNATRKANFGKVLSTPVQDSILSLDANSWAPTYWDSKSTLTAYNGDNNWKILLPDSVLFKEVAYIYNSTLDYDHGMGIFAIYMNCNDIKMHMYQLKKKEIEADTGVINEMFAWHGSHPQVVESIMKTGFERDWSTGGRQVYGHGTYFAKRSSYSWGESYAKPNLLPTPGGPIKQKMIILSRIVCGQKCIGQNSASITTLPKTSKGMPFNSMVDQIADPHVIVLGSGSDSQVFPEFVIEFRDPS